MDNKIENLIDNAIKSEFEDLEFKNQDSTELKNENIYKELIEEQNFILKNLSSLVPKEIYKLIRKFDDISLSLSRIQAQYFYKRGVISGLTNLRYLGEVTPETIALKEEIYK